MMWDFWMMTCMSQLHQDWGVYKDECMMGRGSQFWDFRCIAYRAKLIPSRMVWWVPTLNQLGLLYLITTKMCLVYWLIWIGIFQQSGSCFYWILFLEWPSSQWAQLKGLEYLVKRTAIPYQSWQRLEEERSASFRSPTPLRLKLWHIYDMYVD